MYGRGHVRTQLSGQSVPRRSQTRRVGGCMPRPKHALHSLRADSSPKPSQTHDNRHLPSLCEALDVSRTEL